jgi:hypothetical protein
VIPTSLVTILVPTILLIIALAVALTVFMWRHCRQRSIASFVKSHYDTRSGAATFSSGDGLGNDIFFIN